MKKTLIALAAVAVSTGAMAQATISGNFTFGYNASETAGVKASGLGYDTAEIRFSASEDLGGGLTASASFGLENINRSGDGSVSDTAATASSLSLRGGFGTIAMGTSKIGNGLRGLGEAGAPVQNLEGEVFGSAVYRDGISYTAPKMGDFTFSIGHTEGAANPGGDQKNSTVQNSNTLAAVYSAGAVNARIDTTLYGKKDLSATAAKNRYRISGNYDLGVAKVGAGYSSLKAKGDTKTTETLLGVSAPIGAFTVGAVFATQQAETAGVKAAKKSGNSFGVEYALSKRTSIIATQASWKTKGAKSDKETNILVSHSF